MSSPPDPASTAGTAGDTSSGASLRDNHSSALRQDPLQTPVTSLLGSGAEDYRRLLSLIDPAERVAGRPVSKVNQVDARILDEELLDLLRLQLSQATSLFSPGFMDRWRPELWALLHLILFRCTILMGQPTPGMAMQHLTYTHKHGGPSRPWQRLALTLLYIGGYWSFLGLRRFMTLWGWATLANTTQPTHPNQPQPPQEEGEGEGRYERYDRYDRYRVWAYRSLDVAETAFRLAWLCNTLAFLRHGRYPWLLERLTGLTLTYQDHNRGSGRVINFAFMNRQLLWEHFSALALTALPLVDWHAARRRVSNLLRQPHHQDTTTVLPTTTGGVSPGPCVLCGAGEACSAYVLIDCGHVCCYYCLAAARAQDPHFQCHRCGSYYSSSRRWTPAT